MNDFADAMLLADDKKQASLARQRASARAKRHHTELLDQSNESVDPPALVQSSIDWQNAPCAVAPRAVAPRAVESTFGGLDMSAEDDEEMPDYDMHEMLLDSPGGHAREAYFSGDEETSAERLAAIGLDHPLHPYTNVTCTEFLSDFLSLLRSANVCKARSEELLTLIRSALPEPNNLPQTIAKLLRDLDIDHDLFMKRVVCTSCKSDLVSMSVHQCPACSAIDQSKRAIIYDGNVRAILSIMVSRLRLSIEAYTNTFSGTQSTTSHTDIPFGKVYQQFWKEKKSQRPINLLMHLDGEKE